ncbi:MAG: type II toxin-antitoxin system HipA family toxin [Oligoflexales bacterium]|nr:type II toxin-antitoxin system HipA family toxin [Oligoflexales bacterium]
MKVDVLVYASWYPLEQPQLMGLLSAGYLKGKESFSFEFDTSWLKKKNIPRLDPDLPLVHGKSFPQSRRTLFGIFSDAAPDRWGRRLMSRREKVMARREERPERPLMELDFLLGVDDSGRMGALRFKRELSGPFLEDDRESPAPPITDLRKLEHASMLLEHGDSAKVEEALAILLRPGGSLGGARPKANVLDPSGSLWIAKFPSASDDIDVGGWEEVTASLARAAGISVSESKAVKLGSKHHTFLTRRFDRWGSNIRYAYASALTLLGKRDGDSHESSYLDIAEVIISQCTTPKAQLHELWRRIVFSIIVSNADDHLRNHGFLYDFAKNGWTLSPAFDVNPVQGSGGLTLSIDENDNSLDLDLARSVAPYFQIEKTDADQIIQQLLAVRKGWRPLAKKVGIKSAEIDQMASVFEAER